MLAELRIKNLALIEELALTFEPGFNVLTGETGAGKSILVGAINLILGSRASSDLIRRGSEEAEVQALFIPQDATGLTARLQELGLPEEDQVIIRRVLPRSGRNRIYINGALATLSQLSALGGDMVAVSGQHEHQRLLDPDQQLLFLDQFGGLMPLREEMSRAYNAMTEIESKASGLKKEIHRAKERLDLYQFQAREIEEAGLTPGEDDELDQERELIRNAEKIYSLVQQSYDRLYGASGAVIEVLDMIRQDLERAIKMDGRLEPVFGQVQEAFHQLDDAAGTLRGQVDQYNFDPDKLAQVEDRVALLNRLKRKYGPTLDEVIRFGQEAAGHMDSIADMESRLTDLESEAAQNRETALKTARRLSKDRQEAARDMADRITEVLRSLGMPQLEFDIFFQPQPENPAPGSLGWDEVIFMIAPNLGEELMALSKIASGGELSRAMLGIKSLLAGQDNIQTIIFDEVDTGIGGAVAEVVGRKISELAQFHQLICITHLPQIAAFGGSHYQVYKSIQGKRTITGIKSLSEKERIEELARMLGGEQPTRTTKALAREMIARHQ